jgi:hypothetical protein
MIPPGSPLLNSAFIALALALAATFVLALYLVGSHRLAIRGAIGAALWMALTATAAARGWLRFDSPPTMLLVFAAVFAIALGIARSRVGLKLVTGLPLEALVGFQGFRVLVELLLHRAYREGLMPVQMSYSGRNFDIVTGLTAIALGVWLASGRRSLRLVALWNVMGVGLLLNVLIVALLSAPTPFRVFMNEPSNIWVTQAPWIWLPAVMVLCAVMGHGLVFRYLLHARRQSRGTADVRFEPRSARHHPDEAVQRH